MILLKKDTINRTIVTVTENATLSAPADISTNICRYNEFLIEVTTGTEDLLNGVINLNINGYYSYNIYQMADPTNLDISLTSGVVETGKVYLQGDKKPITSSYTDNDNNDYIAYQ